MHPCEYRFNMHGRLSERYGLGQVVTKIVRQVETVWETKQVYTRLTLKSKYVTIHRVNRWNSLKVNLGNSVMLLDSRNSTSKGS